MNHKAPRSRPIVSVIIPHLNQADHLRHCLLSLQSQTIPAADLEIVVVDNESTALPSEICSTFDNVRLEQEATPGPGPARNRGASLSCSDILAFIDADCTADAGWIGSIVAALENGGNEIIGGDVCIAVADPAKLTLLEAYEAVFAYRQEEYIRKQGFSGTGNLAMRRSAYKAVGPFAGIDIAEDRDWGRRATALGYAVRYIPEMIVFHPARESFEELFAKWDRHIAHDFEELDRGVAARLRWTLLALATAASPPLELWRILTSRRISGWRSRCLATAGVCRIRLYRARKMLGLLSSRPRARSSRTWNRV